MAKKAPRRTAERIQETALALFNRYGEPNVSTGQIAAELGISPGNLHYHHPAKDGLVNQLFDQYTLALTELLPAADGVRDAEDAWFFMHSLFERIWAYRFLYRDLNLLLSRNRHLEAGMRQVLLAQAAALRRLLAGLQGSGVLRLPEDDADALATRQVLLLSYWLSYAYALDPRHALEPEGLQTAVLRGAGHALGLLLPYLVPAQQEHLRHLLRAYEPDPITENPGVPHE
jgi:AcrR family transcriptional regulator